MKRRGILFTLVIALGLLTASAMAQRPGDDEGPRRGRGGPEGRRGFRPPNPILAVLDADEDGTLSADEIENATAALKKLDENKDGQLTREELRPAGGRFGGRGPNPEEFVARFMEQDRNDDGKVSEDELPPNRRRMLEFADTNEDGAIEKAEAEQMAQRFSRRRGGDDDGRRRGGREGRRGGDRPERSERE